MNATRVKCPHHMHNTHSVLENQEKTIRTHHVQRQPSTKAADSYISPQFNNYFSFSVPVLPIV